MLRASGKENSREERVQDILSEERVE